jgi:hypothetical protein
MAALGGDTIWREVFNSLTAKSVLAGEKLLLFVRYVLNFYVQCTNQQILTSSKKIQF